MHAGSVVHNSAVVTGPSVIGLTFAATVENGLVLSQITICDCSAFSDYFFSIVSKARIAFISRGTGYTLEILFATPIGNSGNRIGGIVEIGSSIKLIEVQDSQTAVGHFIDLFIINCIWQAESSFDSGFRGNVETSNIAEFRSSRL